MKSVIKFFTLALCIMPVASFAAGPLSGTAGNNLTAFNGSIGSMNNNNWNQIANPGKPLPSADFNNCNSLILRCAQPKCASGGCTGMDIAIPIVSGCLNANENCQSHGDDLIQSVAAQLVASSTAKANQQAADAKANASQAAGQQSSEQLAAMQQQMQEIQDQMAQQNEQAAAAAAAAESAQRQLAEQQAAAIAAAAAKTTTATPTSDAVVAANNGVSADVLARQQASGQILTQLENAEASLKDLKKTMQTVFDYAGCDSSGNNCKGPKRVAVFKEKAGQFFDPYENVLDETYDALIMAQSLGVDITDIYMMLNNSCNVWGKYMCDKCQDDDEDCGSRGYYEVKKTQKSDGTYKVDTIQPHCTLLQMVTSRDTIQQEWMDMGTGSSGAVRIACASDAIDNSMLFRGRKKQSNIDIEVLKRIIEQDAPSYIGRGSSVEKDALPMCGIDNTEFADLQKNISLKTLPKKVCMKDLKQKQYITGKYDGSETPEKRCGRANGTWNSNTCFCPDNRAWDSTDNSCVAPDNDE